VADGMRALFIRRTGAASERARPQLRGPLTESRGRHMAYPRWTSRREATRCSMHAMSGRGATRPFLRVCRSRSVSPLGCVGCVQMWARQGEAGDRHAISPQDGERAACRVNSQLASCDREASDRSSETECGDGTKDARSWCHRAVIRHARMLSMRGIARLVLLATTRHERAHEGGSVGALHSCTPLIRGITVYIGAMEQCTLYIATEGGGGSNRRSRIATSREAEKRSWHGSCRGTWGPTQSPECGDPTGAPVALAGVGRWTVVRGVTSL